MIVVDEDQQLFSGTVDSNGTRWRTRKVVVLLVLDGSDVKFYTIAANLIVPV